MMVFTREKRVSDGNLDQLDLVAIRFPPTGFK
jgi:hypothetical protein